MKLFRPNSPVTVLEPMDSDIPTMVSLLCLLFEAMQQPPPVEWSEYIETVRARLPLGYTRSDLESCTYLVARQACAAWLSGWEAQEMHG